MSEAAARLPQVDRVAFDVRDALLRRRNPDVFSVPRRLVRHMAVVADLAGGDDGAVEDALEAAWKLSDSQWATGARPTTASSPATAATSGWAAR